MAYEKAKKPAKEETDDDILQYARDGLKACVDEEETERTKMRDDLRFATLDQWPADIRRDRENDVENGPRPCLTIDKYSQYRTQVVNDARQGKPGINVRPQDDFADPETAKILKGLIRNIEDQSNADIAYTAAIGSAVDIGLGYFRITTEYVSPDSFDQELFIRPIPNTFSVYLGKHFMPDGSDAESGYICEAMPVEKFKEMFPKAKVDKKEFEGLDPSIIGFWRDAETITIVEEFCIKKTPQTVHFLADGTTISEEDYKAWPDEAGVRPSIQDTRSTVKKQLKWRKMTAVEVLEKRDLPGQYIPIVECIGREAWVEGHRILWGLVRPVKDSLRMYNYFASTITERMGLAPKMPYIGAVGQFEGLEAKWRQANKKNFAYLEYKAIDVNGNAIPAPQRVGPTPVEAALLQHMQVIEHDVQTSLGMFKAAVGEAESQQSGRAILALQRESDTSTYHFGANLGVSIRHAGRILVDLIPHYYDTKRIVRIMGEDGEVKTVPIDPAQDEAHRKIQTSEGMKSIYNPGVGKYDVSITVGPSYNTKRMEAAATFVELAKGATDPGSAAVLRYLTVRNSDNAGSEEAARMLKALLPPQVANTDEPIPPAAMAKLNEMGMKMQAMAEEGAKLQQENVQLKAGAQSKAMQTQADHDAKMKELELEKVVEREKANLAREKAEAEFRLKKWIAEQELAIERMKAANEADAEVDQAISKVQSMATIHETKVQGLLQKDAAGREAGEAQASSENSAAQVQEVTRAFVDGVQQIVEALKQKQNRNLSITMPDGRQVKATVE
jgi:hypothetical protein